MKDDTETVYADPGEDLYRFYTRVLLILIIRDARVVKATFNGTTIRVRCDSNMDDLTEKWQLQRDLDQASLRGWD